MNNQPLSPTFERARRIGELKAAADAQRHLLAAQLGELAESFRPLAVARHAAVNIIQGVSFVSRVFGRGPIGWGGLLAGAGLRRLEAAETPARRFPWKVAIASGVGAMEVVRWVKEKRRPR
jgi:hypothetical protein